MKIKVVGFVLGCGLLCSKATRHVVQIDVGSSGTRVHVFDTNPLRQVWSLEGIAVTETEEVTGLIDSMLDFCEVFITGIKIDPTTVPVFLGATAGLRVLNVTQQNLIMNASRASLRDSNFKFESDSWCRILSGEEEGVFGWITINYLLKKLGTNSTFPVIDFGGTSIQVTFNPDRAIDSHQFSLHTDDIEYNLFTQSFLHYGINSALHMLHTMFDRNTCEPGISSWKYCVSSVSSLISQHNKLPQIQIPMNKEIYLISYVQYLYDFFQVDPYASLTDLKQSAKNICTLSPDAYVLYVAQSSEDLRNGTYCFGAVYVYEFLVTYVGVDPDSSRIRVLKGNVVSDAVGMSHEWNVSWALGSVWWELNSVTFKRLEYVGLGLDLGIAYYYLVVFFELLGVLLFCLCVTWTTKNREQKKYALLRTRSFPTPVRSRILHMDELHARSFSSGR